MIRAKARFRCRPSAVDRKSTTYCEEDSSAKPAEPKTPELSPERKSKFRSYVTGISAVKVGIESLNLAVPILLLTQFHAAVAISALYLAAELAGLFSGVVGGVLVDKLGAGKVMALSAGIQFGSVALIPLALAAAGPLSLPAVFALFIINSMVGEVFEVARRAALPQIVGKDEGLLRKHNGKLYMWREMAATAGVFGAGWVVKALGPVGAIWLHPIFYAVAAFTFLRLWKSRRDDAKAAANPAPAKDAETKKAGVKGWASDLIRGAKIVFSTPKLRVIMGINIPVYMVHKLFHTVVAVVYAAKVLANPALAAVLLGVWNLGELAGAWYVERKGADSRIKTWLKIAAAASSMAWGLWLFPTAPVAIAISFVLALGMIVNELSIASYMQAAVPEKDLGSVTGFVYSFGRAVSMLGLLAAGWAFDKFNPATSSLAIAVLFSVAALVYVFGARYFRHDETKAGAPTNSPED